jgi:AcrR family transcriptional regulator
MKTNPSDTSKGVKKRLRTRKKERMKKFILDAAEEFYSKKPMTEVSLSDIAEAVFVSRKTIYNYFKNKDDVFFAIGNRVFKNLNETIAGNLTTELSGKEQVLLLCEKTFKDGEENPIVLKITREFYDRIKNMNLSAEDIFNDLAKKLGPSTLNNLIEDSESSVSVDLQELFDEPNFGEFFIQLLRNGNLWLRAIRKGKKDKTIRNDLPDMQIVLYITMLMNGLIDEMALRQANKDRMGIERDTIISNTLNLIGAFLDNNV